MPKTIYGELVNDLRSMDKIISLEGEVLRNNTREHKQARFNWAFAVALTHILTILIRKEESHEN